jgi:acyl-coenzyme A synthetase/AMP-(fatty) acid ligase
MTPVTAQRPRGQQITDILFTDEPLPRTATGKLRRWALQIRLEEPT